jgi:hypothetical protein
MAKIFHASLQGLSKNKDQVLLDSNIDKTKWLDICIEKSGLYLFVPQYSDLRCEYDQFWKITEIMETNTPGFKTHRDHFAVDFEKDLLFDRIQEMSDRNISDIDYAQRYLLKDNRDWSLAEARRILRSDNDWNNKVVDCLYRPFDKRYCYCNTVAMDYPRQEFAGKDTLYLGLGRQGIAVNGEHPSNVISTLVR